MKIGLDSSVFKNRGFLAWLSLNREKFDTHISVIVYVETALWYSHLGLSINDLDRELNKINVKVVDFSKDLARKVVQFAKQYSKQLPFKHHARDYLIGTTAISQDATSFITYNKSHFNWLSIEGLETLTPEELVEKFV